MIIAIRSHSRWISPKSPSKKSFHSDAINSIAKSESRSDLIARYIRNRAISFETRL